MKKLVIALFVLILLSSAAMAQELIRVVVNGENVNIRSAPSSKSKVYDKAGMGDIFLVEPTLIQDKSDKSTWYKIVFDLRGMDEDFQQPQLSAVYDFSYPYISSNFVKKMPLTDYDKEELEWFRLGRPAKHKVGDDMSQYLKDFAVQTFIFTAPIPLRNAPISNTTTTTLPVGTAIVFPNETDFVPGLHRDMNDVSWIPLIAAKDHKILGWIRWDEWDGLPMKSQDNSQ